MVEIEGTDEVHLKSRIVHVIIDGPKISMK